ncbi:MAG TPA: hypothetical protein VGP32_08340 [Steroidobacteraceae bacterium]|jgi:hypothetical protein|nr:hypothetical protein [Steroidobacteraceae bacterium]
MDWRTTLFATKAPGWSIFVRLLVGLVVFPDSLGGAWSLDSRLAGRRIAGAEVSS